MSATVRIRVNEDLYLRDPEETTLGRKIIGASVQMIDEIGYENFTFKKLGKEIASTEASIYRYFKSKNKLLNYLRAWHWGWLQYKIQRKTENIEDPRRKLEITLRVIIESAKDDPLTPHIDEAALHRIIVAESGKSYLSTEMKLRSKEGFYEGLRSFCYTVSKIIAEVNPKYKYPKALVISIMVTAHRLMFYSEHALNVTEVQSKKRGGDEIIHFLESLVFSALGIKDSNAGSRF